MKVIYKYELQIKSQQVIEIPRQSKFLTLQLQDGVPCVWLEVNTNNTNTTQRVFKMHGTGHEFVNNLDVYLGTVLINGFVWHYYEEVL
jgi:hypothetical protein